VWFSKEWTADFAGCRITVVNSWGFGLIPFGLAASTKLYIDNELVDSCAVLFSTWHRPLLRGVIHDEDGKHYVDVYVNSWGLTGVEAAILVDGCPLDDDVR
jgi:hypothetical protein